VVRVLVESADHACGDDKLHRQALSSIDNQEEMDLCETLASALLGEAVLNLLIRMKRRLGECGRQRKKGRTRLFVLSLSLSLSLGCCAGAKSPDLVSLRLPGSGAMYQ